MAAGFAPSDRTVPGRGFRDRRGYGAPRPNPVARDDSGCVGITTPTWANVGIPRGRAGSRSTRWLSTPSAPAAMAAAAARRNLMRPDRDAGNGLTELMVIELPQRAGEIGVTRVTLNFAMFRSVFERGGRLGAGPVRRL